MQEAPEAYENGLLYKPQLFPMDHELIWVEDEQINGLCVYLSDEVLQQIGEFKLISIDLKEKDLWVQLPQYYITVPNLSDKTIECINGKEMLISFFDEQVKTILGLRLS